MNCCQRDVELWMERVSQGKEAVIRAEREELGKQHEQVAVIATGNLSLLGVLHSLREQACLYWVDSLV